MEDSQETSVAGATNEIETEENSKEKSNENKVKMDLEKDSVTPDDESINDEKESAHMEDVPNLFEDKSEHENRELDMPVSGDDEVSEVIKDESEVEKTTEAKVTFIINLTTCSLGKGSVNLTPLPSNLRMK